MISAHLSIHHPLSNLHWGFQERKPTVTALLSVTQDWFANLDKHKEICCVFFDIKKTFDSVSHKGLVIKLSAIDFHPLLRWLTSYLTCRQQHVVINGAASKCIFVVSGVPQGSVLGPLLFLLFIDDISFLSLSYLSKLNLYYADDTLYYKVVSSAMDYVSLQQDISAGSTANLLSFNLSKCKFMLVSHKRHHHFRCMVFLL